MTDKEGIKDCVFLLLQYCERLLSDKLALLSLARTSVPRLQAQRIRERLEIEKKMEPVFHTFHALLREENWPELHHTLQQVLSKHLEQ